jgi:hypothetical protein
MANVNLIASARIVANGGEITSDRYLDAGAGAANNLKAGQLCYLSGGTVEPVVDTGSAAKLENDESPFDAAAEYVISLEDKTADGTHVAVQKIDADTIMEGYVVNAAADDVEMDTDDIGTVCEGYVDANGRFGVNNLTTKGVFVIVDVDTNYDPFKNGGDFEEDSGGVRHSRVQFRILASKLL